MTGSLARAAVRLRRVSPFWGWVSLCLLASVTLVSIAARDLANHRYINGDEPWIMSASYNLAFHGRFGSDTWSGFHGAEDHWFISLPLFNVAQAIVFRVFGAGIAEARLVSLIAGVALIWLAGWFAFRAFGLAVAGVSLSVLLLARIGSDFPVPEIPLYVLARIARYDMLVIALYWVVIVLLYRWRQCLTPARAAAIGIVCGLATLTQFYGVAALVVAATYWLFVLRDKARWRFFAVALVAFAGTVAPYAVYVVVNWDDFIGQMSLYPGRHSFLRPGFYLANVLDEYQRYRWIVDPFLDREARRVATFRGAVLGVLLCGASLAAIRPRDEEGGERGRALRLLWVSLVVPFVLLACIDTTKLFLYATIMLPSLSMLAAVGWVGVARGLLAYEGRPLAGFAQTFAIVAIAVLITVSGISAIRNDRAFARGTNRYADVGAAIEQYLSPGSTVIGPDRWWWTQREHRYYSLLGLLWGLYEHDERIDPTPMAELVRPTGAEFLIINAGNELWFRFFRPDLESSFWGWIDQCTTRLAEWVDPKYGPIRIYRIEPLRAGPACDATSASR